MYWPTFFGPPPNFLGGTQIRAKILVYVVAHLIFLLVAHLTGENVQALLEALAQNVQD